MELFSSDYEGARRNVDKIAGRNTAENAMKTATSGASGIGQSTGESVASAGKNVGLTKAQAEGVGQNVANTQSQSSLGNEYAKSIEQQNRELAEAENKAGEEKEKEMQENDTWSTIGTANQTAGTAALSAINPAFGALGAGLAGISRLGANALKSKGGGWRKAGNILDALLCDERCKYKSKIKDQRLLHLLDK